MRWTLVVLTFAAGFCWTGCAPVHNTRIGAGTETGPSPEIRADAYLFEALLRRDGKPTTFQLEVYRTDTLLGLSGKGYLGKGALRGRLTADSIEVYFPSTNEYLSEAIDSLTNSSGCEQTVTSIRLLYLFRKLPDSVDLPVGLNLTTDRHDPEKPAFVVSADSCAWRVEIGYDLQDGAWRIRKFDYSDDDGTSLSGQRIRYRGGASVKLNRFMAPIPTDAVRVTR
jgi:hypothetical protein